MRPRRRSCRVEIGHSRLAVNTALAHVFRSGEILGLYTKYTHAKAGGADEKCAMDGIDFPGHLNVCSKPLRNARTILRPSRSLVNVDSEGVVVSIRDRPRTPSCQRSPTLALNDGPCTS